MSSHLSLAAVADLLSLSTATTQRLLESGAIASSLDAHGRHVADLDAVLAWRDQREARRHALADLAREAQRLEGSAPRRPPGAEGDLDTAAADIPFP